jgi:hypothetical protein
VTYEDLFGHLKENTDHPIKYKKEQTYENDLFEWAENKEAVSVSRKMKRLGIQMDFIPPEFQAEEYKKKSPFMKRQKMNLKFGTSVKNKIESSFSGTSHSQSASKKELEKIKHISRKKILLDIQNAINGNEQFEIERDLK